MTNRKKTNDEIIKSIERGDYQDCFIVYNRKSLDEPDSQKNSLAYQKAENARLQEREQLPIADITIEGFCKDGLVSEKHSSFKEGDDLTITKDGYVQYRIERPKFQRLMHHLSLGHFKGVICLCWDRISRNKGDDTAVRKLMKHGVEFRFAYATYDKSSSGELHMDVDGMFSQHHSRVTSEKVTKTTRELRGKGICTYRAPIGYLNTGNMHNKPLDPERAPIIKEMFKLYATDDWSLSDISRYANQQGLRSMPMRPRRTRQEILADEGDEEDEREKVTLPISKSRISKILSNPFYTGKVLGPDGLHIPSKSHEALVDEYTFNQVQMLLHNKNVSTHYTEKLDHPLRGMIRCGSCKRIYTPYMKKGYLYFYSRCADGCQNTKRSFNFDFITEEIGKRIAKLHFTQEELDEFNERTRTDIALLEQKRETKFEQIERHKKQVRGDLAYLRDERLQLLKSGAYTPEDIVSEQCKLEAKLKELRTSEEISEEAMRDFIEDVILLSELIKTAQPVYEFAQPHEKETIIKILFSELFVLEDTLNYKVRKGFEPLLACISTECYRTDWLSEHLPHHKHVKANIKRLQKVLPFIK